MASTPTISTGLKRLLVVAIAIGIFFRFYNLDTKVYWYDEIQTSTRISGYTQEEVIRQAYTGEEATVGNLLATYQYPNPTRDLHDAIDALAQHPEHSPLYYLLARFWLQIFGHSVTAIRSLSAIIGVLVIPCAYCLAWELWHSRPIALLAATLISLSPFHVLYAQEAREYSLWTLTILLSSASLLRARSRSNFQNWSLYSLSLAWAFYAHPFSGLVAMSHCIYMAIVSDWKRKKKIISYVAASAIALVLFSPWLVVVIQNRTDFVQNTISTTFPRDHLPLIWGLNLGRIFYDVNQGMAAYNPMLYFTLFLTVYAIYILCRHSPRRVWLFVITLMGVTGLALIVPDVVLGGRRSSITRYAIPCYLGIQFAVVYLLSLKLSQPRWRYVLYFLIFCGVVSSTVSSHIEVWWHKSPTKSRHNPEIARIINSSDRPVVISDEIPGRILSLAHDLDGDVGIRLVAPPYDFDIDPNREPLYFYRPSDPLKANIQQRYNVRFVKAFDKGWLWEIESNSNV